MSLLLRFLHPLQYMKSHYLGVVKVSLTKIGEIVIHEYFHKPLNFSSLEAFHYLLILFLLLSRSLWEVAY